MIKIEINNNEGKLIGKKKSLLKIQKAFKIRNPGAFFIRKKMGSRMNGWDGKINYINDSFIFKLGLLPRVMNFIRENITKKITIDDFRKDLGVEPKVPKRIGELKPRPEQIDAIKSVVFNKIDETDIYFPLSSLKMATNAGKSLIMAGIYLSYRRKIPTVVVVNDGDLFEQFKTEFPKLVPAEDLGFVRGKEVNYKNFTIVMAQTVSRNIKKHKDHLSKFGICLVDEADLADNKTYKTILTHCYNAMIRVGLSATLYMGKLAKHKPKNMNLRGMFSEITYEISKKEQQELGYSTRVIVKILTGNQLPGIEGDWQSEYNHCITNNEDRAIKCVERIRHNAKFGRIPAIVICQYHDHIEFMEKTFKKKLGKKFKIASVHHKTKNRKSIIEKFRKGDIDILIGSYILRRGKNFPKLKYLLNASGSDSAETVDQILGRLERTSEDKSKAYMEDFFDEGFYLKRHSKHRVVYYKNMGLKLRLLYKEGI